VNTCNHVFVDRFTRVDGARVYVCERCGLNKMTRPFYPGGPQVVLSDGPPPILYRHGKELAMEEVARYFQVPPAPGSQVDPVMAKPSRTPEQHAQRELIRRLDAAPWEYRAEVGKWVPTRPQDAADLEAYLVARAARDAKPVDTSGFVTGTGWTDGVKYEPGQIVVVARDQKRPTVLERIWAWFKN
jgi:hypothetical protein